MATQRVDVADVGDAAARNDGNIDRPRERDRRLDIAALEQPVAADVGEQQRRDAGLLEAARQILAADVGDGGPALGPAHAIAAIAPHDKTPGYAPRAGFAAFRNLQPPH